MLGLFHDAHEALVGDITTPVKNWLSASEQEKALEMRMLHLLGFGGHATESNMRLVKRADLAALRIEVAALGMDPHLFGLCGEVPDLQKVTEPDALCRRIGVLQDQRQVSLGDVLHQSMSRFLAAESAILARSALVEPVHGKPRRSGRGKVARTA
jgi:hypothetical protein